MSWRDEIRRPSLIVMTRSRWCWRRVIIWGRRECRGRRCCVRLRRKLTARQHVVYEYEKVLRQTVNNRVHVYRTFRGNVQWRQRTFENHLELYINDTGMYIGGLLMKIYRRFRNGLVTIFDWSSIETSQPVCCLRLWYLTGWLKFELIDTFL